MLEKTEAEIKNDKFRDKIIIGHIAQYLEKQDKKNTTQKTTKMSNMDSFEKPG